MKKEIFYLLFCIALVTASPLYAMAPEENNDPWHITIAQKFEEAWDSAVDLMDEAKRLLIPHKCFVCSSELWPIDPNNNTSSNGTFSPVPDEIMHIVISTFSPQDLPSLPLVSKKMCNLTKTMWDALDKKNKVHVSQNVCPKEKYFENYKYYQDFIENNRDIFSKDEDNITYSVKNPIFLTFLETPCESTWAHPFMMNKSEGKFFSVSIEKRKFEVFTSWKGVNEPEWLQDAKKNLDGETLFMICSDHTFTTHRSRSWECLLREVKENGEAPNAQ